jgi:hydroxymethylglutaryl-CoA reductase (NADPH)
MNSELLPYVIVWSLCLAYFFGFFGISFLDTDALHQSTSSDDLEAEVNADPSLITDRPLKVMQAVNKTVPRADGPICSDVQVKNVGESSNLRNTSNLVEGAELDFQNMEDDDVLQSVLDGSLKDYQLEKKLGDYERAVKIRRGLYEHLLEKKIDAIPYSNYDYNKVFGANCEIVVGYVPIPVGIVGPLVINEEPIYVPMATTEGCLVASTNRGCKAISMSGGCNALLLKDAITRAPCIKLPSAVRAAAMKKWIDKPENYKILEAAFNSTTSFGRLESVTATISGRLWICFAFM